MPKSVISHLQKPQLNNFWYNNYISDSDDDELPPNLNPPIASSPENS